MYMLYSTDSKNLNRKEDTSKDTWASFGRGKWKSHGRQIMEGTGWESRSEGMRDVSCGASVISRWSYEWMEICIWQGQGQEVDISKKMWRTKIWKTQKNWGVLNNISQHWRYGALGDYVLWLGKNTRGVISTLTHHKTLDPKIILSTGIQECRDGGWSRDWGNSQPITDPTWYPSHRQA